MHAEEEKRLWQLYLSNLRRVDNDHITPIEAYADACDQLATYNRELDRLMGKTS
jgi:hypothetical protein